MADPIAAMFRNTGWIGVDIFFAISGFMIANILSRDSGDIFGFFRRRLFRIVPIFVVAVAVFLLASIATGVQSELLKRVWSPILLLNGWTIPFFGSENVPFKITWSLSVEETAYVLMGLACLSGRGGLRLMLFAMLIGGVLLRWTLVATQTFDLADLYFFVPARLDAIALGGLAASGYFGALINRRAATWVFAAAVSLLLIIFQGIDVGDPFMPLFGYLVFGVAAAGLVAALAKRNTEVSRAFPIIYHWLFNWAANLGKLSYFVYLFHIFVIEALMLVAQMLGFQNVKFWPGFILTVALTQLLATLSWRYFEYPLICYGRTRRSAKARNSMHEGGRL